MPYLWALGPVRTPNDGLPQVIAAHAATAQQSIALLQAKRADLEKSYETLTVRGVEFSARLETLTEAVIKDRAEAGAAVARLQQTFTENETARSAVFEAASKEMKESFAVFQLDALKQSDTLVTLIEEKRKEAARIVQVVGNIGVTGNYQQIAIAEGSQANFWRWVTVAFFLAGLIVAGATFWKFWGEPFSPENAWAVAIRLLYAIAITAPAWYTARESARHRTNSDRARQTELELASIGPFIELMPEDKKVEIREQLSKLYFGRPMDAHSVSAPVDMGGLKDLVVEVVKAVRK